MKASHFEFGLAVEHDKATGNILAVYFHIRKGQVAQVEEFAEGNAFANYNKSGKLIGIEVLGPCEIKVFDRIPRAEPMVKRFLKQSLPRAMALPADAGALSATRGHVIRIRTAEASFCPALPRPENRGSAWAVLREDRRPWPRSTVPRWQPIASRTARSRRREASA